MPRNPHFLIYLTRVVGANCNWQKTWPRRKNGGGLGYVKGRKKLNVQWHLCKSTILPASTHTGLEAWHRFEIFLPDRKRNREEKDKSERAGVTEHFRSSLWKLLRRARRPLRTRLTRMNSFSIPPWRTPIPFTTSPLNRNHSNRSSVFEI